jgi:hypothetical protein
MPEAQPLAGGKRAGQSREGEGNANRESGGHGQEHKDGHHEEKDKVLGHFFP